MPDLPFQGAVRNRGTNTHIPNTDTLTKVTGPQQSAKPGDAPKDNKQEGKKDDNVVDADFEEVKDENKEKSA